MAVQESAGCGVTLAGDGVRDGSPFVWQAPAADRTQPGWSGLLLASAEPVEPTPQAAELAAELLAQLARALHGVTPVDALARLGSAYADANALLLERNAHRGLSRKVLLGISCVVQAGGDLFIAQTPPGQLLVRQRHQLVALPELASWLPDYLPREHAPAARPLGLTALAAPLLLRTGASNVDVLLALSSGVARALALDAGTRLRAGDPQRMLDEVLAAARRRGVGQGFAAVALPAHARAGARPLSHPRQPGHDFISARDESRNRTANPLDQDAPNVQTDGADRRTIAWLGSPAPGQPARHFATPSERRSAGPGGLTDERRPATFHPAATQRVTDGHRSIDGSGAGNGTAPDGFRAALARLLAARRMSRAAH